MLFGLTVKPCVRLRQEKNNKKTAFWIFFLKRVFRITDRRGRARIAKPKDKRGPQTGLPRCKGLLGFGLVRTPRPCARPRPRPGWSSVVAAVRSRRSIGGRGGYCGTEWWGRTVCHRRGSMGRGRRIGGAAPGCAGRAPWSARLPGGAAPRPAPPGVYKTLGHAAGGTVHHGEHHHGFQGGYWWGPHRARRTRASQ